MFSFALMDLGSIDRDALPDYLAAAPIYGEYDARFLGLGLDGLADWLVNDLSRAGAVRLEGGRVVSAG